METQRTGKSPDQPEKLPAASRSTAGPISPGTGPELLLEMQQQAGNQAVGRMLQAGAGQPLPGPLQQYFSAYFGRDLGQVRLHTDTQAAASAQALRAKAYTLGQNIVFGPGRYRPAEPSGLRLLAHELVHTLQARQAGFAGTGRLQPGHAHGTAGMTPNHHAQAETQARRLSGAALSGMPVSEAVRPAAGLHLEPDNGPGGGETAAPAPAPPRRPPGRETMADLLVEWAQAGLLAPPFRPPEVGEIPPLPVSAAQAAQANWPTPYIIAGAAAPALAPSPTPVTPSPPPVRPPLRLVPPPAPSTPVVPGAAPRAGVGIGALATGVLTFAAIMLYASPTAPAWMDTLNQITGAPYSGPEERSWELGLPRPTHDYLRYLNQARRIHPTPDVENDPPPQQLPVPEPAPRRRDEEPPEPCFGANVPRRGGHRRHDAYATRVSQSPSDYYARTPSRLGLAITYDGRTPATPVVWEVKVGFGWFFNPAYQGLRDVTLARFDAQKNLGMAVAGACGYIHFWAIPDRWVASLLNWRWGSTPPVLALPER